MVKQLKTCKWSLLFLILPILFLAFDFNYYSNLFEDFFSIDDAALIQIPQMQGVFDFYLIKSLFTLGNHIDYYPVRDLSYWFDVNVFRGSETNTFAFKAMNFVYFYFFLVFLFFIFYELTRNQSLSLLATLAWSLNPFHNEMLFWISARKDLLFLMFFVISVLAFIKDNHESSHTQRYFFLGVLFFILAAFSKASGVLVALGFPFYYFFLKEKINYLKIKSTVLIVLSMFFVVLNRINYADHNSMYLDYTLLYRMKAGVAALGRSVAGFFWPFYNSIDIENWGKWGELNSHFILPGIIFLLIIFLFLFYSSKINKKFSIFLILLILVLATTPGLNPLHRNFYSVRYYVLPFLIIYVAIIIYFYKLRAISFRRLQFFLVLFILFSLFTHKLESPYWKNNLSIVEKSLIITPGNPALMKNYLIEYEMIKRWGRQSVYDDRKASEVAHQLLEICKKNVFKNLEQLNGDLCLNLWSFQDDFPSFPFLNQVAGKSQTYLDYAIDQFAHLSHLPRHRVQLHFLSVNDILDSTQKVREIYYSYILHNQSTEHRRMLGLALLCQKENRIDALVKYFKKNYLISQRGVLNFVSSISPEHQNIRDCILSIKDIN